MAIVRWEPFRDLLSLQERMNRLFDESFRGTRAAPRTTGPSADPGRPRSTSTSRTATSC